MQGAWDGTIPPDYYAYAQGRESGGDDNARNDKSSATGRYQFIDGTWNQLMQQHPDLGLTADGRTDPDQSTRAMQAFTHDNAQSLASAGAPVNTHSLYLAHRFGVGGALKVLGADPSAPVGSVLPNVITANPDLRGKTVADIIGGKAMAYASPDNSNGALSTSANLGSGILAPGGQPGGGGLENGLYGAAAALAGIYNPAQAAQLNSMRTANAGTYTTSALPDGTLVRINNKTGQVEKLPGNYAKDERKWGIVGKDKYGQPTYGWSPTQEAYDAAHPAGGAAATPDDTSVSDLHGKEFMDQITKDKGQGYAGRVQAILEGREDFPTGMFLKTPVGQQLAEDVTQADPGFEQGNAGARKALRNKFNGGTIGDQITAGNTAIQHAKEMSDSLEAMKGNGENDFHLGPLSYYANAAHNAMLKGTGTPEASAYNDFKTAKNHFAEEVTKFYSGSSGSEAERTRALSNLDEAKSLPELRSAIQKEALLMQSKVNALQDRWRDGMDPGKRGLVSDFPLLKPETQQALALIQKRNGISIHPAETPAAAPAGNRPSLDSIFK